MTAMSYGERSTRNGGCWVLGVFEFDGKIRKVAVEHFPTSRGTEMTGNDGTIVLISVLFALMLTYVRITSLNNTFCLRGLGCLYIW